MGGGGAMRAAAKFVGIGAFTGGVRAGAAENPVNLAARKAVRPVSGSAGSSSSAGGLAVEPAVQKPAWEADDWEFAGGEGGLVVDRFNSANRRLVFGPVPTLEETREATSELKDALEKVYFPSPKSSGSIESFSSFQESKSCITHESSAPKSAIQAFKLLKESHAAQTVVASIASDPNVWTAVMQNPSLVEFLESERKSTGTKFENEESSKGFVDPVESTKPEKLGGLMTLMKDVKLTVLEMVQNLSNFIQSWFAVPEVDKKELESSGGTLRSNAAGGTFMALAMMVIMVVVLKRI